MRYSILLHSSALFSVNSCIPDFLKVLYDFFQTLRTKQDFRFISNREIVELQFFSLLYTNLLHITPMCKVKWVIKRTLWTKIPWKEEPGRLRSMGSLRVRHDWVNSLSLFTFMHWRRKWQPTPVFLPGESQGQRSLVGRRLWGRTELDTTEAT